MAQIRIGIELLSKILASSGATKLKAETFRLAKFDRTEAVVPLWRLLFELIHYERYGEIDDCSRDAYSQLSSDDATKFVKRELQKKGYYSADFAQLPSNMSCGSRELLLAVGWLLSAGQIIDRFVMNWTSVLDDDTSGFHQDEIANTKRNSSWNLLRSPGDVYSRIQQLLWLNNKLRLNLCSLHSLQCQRNRLKHKIHEATTGVKTSGQRDHLSMMEVYLIRNPESLKKSLDLLEEDSERLHDLLLWKDHEGVFWKWMESVLEAKLNPSHDGDDPLPRESSPSDDTVSVASVANARFRESRQTLHDVVIKYEAVVEHLERLCVDHSNGISSKIVDEIASRINLELSIQKANLAAAYGGRNSLKFQDKKIVEPRFVLENKTAQRKSKSHCYPWPVLEQDMSRGPDLSKSQPRSTCHLWPEQIQNTDIEDEIERLQLQIRRLERDVKEKQNYLKTEIERLSERLTDSVCLPPLNRNLNTETRIKI